MAGRVVIGISNSLGGYAALRYGVAQARQRGVPLIAVRAFTCPYYGGARQFEAVAHDAAQADVIAALSEALGGPPRDVPVRVAVGEGVPGRILTAVATEPDDIIVIGGSDRRALGRRGLVARDLALHATCPVIVVPLPEMARSGSQLRLARRAAEVAQQFVRQS